MMLIGICGGTLKANAALNERKTVYVNSVEEFNTALASDTEIILSAGKYNFGQRPVEIIGLSNIEIRGTDMTQVVVETGDECIFYVESSDNICFDNLTIGHELQDYQNSFCPAAVISIFDSYDISIEMCDIYGCGNKGFVASQSQNLSVFATTIRDCSKSIAQLNESDVCFLACTFSGNGYYQYPSNYAFDTMTYTKDKSVDIICRYCNFTDNKNPELIDLTEKYHTVNALFEDCRYNNNSFSDFNNYESDPNLIINSYHMKNGMITINYFSFNFTSEEIVVPDDFAGYPIIAIADYACSSDYVKKITLPEGLKKVGNNAFAECGSLEYIYMPSSVTFIGENALPSNSNISIYGEEGSYAQTYAEENGFLFNKNSHDVSNIFTYIIENGKITIATCKKDARGTIIIPSEIEGYPVTAIAESAFDSCTNLKEIEIADSVESIDDEAFHNCQSLASIHLPKSLKSIGNVKIPCYVFSGCTSLKEFTIDEDCEYFSVKDGILYNKNITGIVSIPPGKEELCIPASVEEHLTGDFDSVYNQHITYPIQEAVSLKKIDVDESNLNLASDSIALYSKDMSTIIAYPRGRKGSYKISDATTTIGGATFTHSKNITELFVPQTVTEAKIGYGHYFGLVSCPNINICGYTGSFIETVAQKEKIPFTPVRTMAEIIGIKKTEKGYKVDLKIDHDTSQDLQNCRVLSAAYMDEENKEIIGFSSKGFQFNNGETSLDTIEVAANEKVIKKIRIYFWDSIDSMKAYSAPYEVYIEE